MLKFWILDLLVCLQKLGHGPIVFKNIVLYIYYASYVCKSYSLFIHFSLYVLGMYIVQASYQHPLWNFVQERNFLITHCQYVVQANLYVKNDGTLKQLRSRNTLILVVLTKINLILTSDSTLVTVKSTLVKSNMNDTGAATAQGLTYLAKWRWF